ncbi:MAG: hypothetical protein FWC62_06930 [Firmicutes bacterium]|nr:hypothetical protein [Bacillota bacterium]
MDGIVGGGVGLGGREAAGGEEDGGVTSLTGARDGGTDEIDAGGGLDTGGDVEDTASGAAAFGANTSGDRAGGRQDAHAAQLASTAANRMETSSLFIPITSASHYSHFILKDKQQSCNLGLQFCNNLAAFYFKIVTSFGADAIRVVRGTAGVL